MSINLVDGTKRGQILPPYISIAYGTISLADAQNGASVTVNIYWMND
jgi:hypothetical protein